MLFFLVVNYAHQEISSSWKKAKILFFLLQEPSKIFFFSFQFCKKKYVWDVITASFNLERIFFFNFNCNWWWRKGIIKGMHRKNTKKKPFFVFTTTKLWTPKMWQSTYYPPPPQPLVLPSWLQNLFF